MEGPRKHGACIVCGRATALVCNVCVRTCYCSQECQKIDFPIHGLLCSDFVEHELTQRPNRNHIRAILFPVDQERPKTIWLPCNTDARGRSPNVEQLLPRGLTVIKRRFINLTKVSSKICLCYCDFSIGGESETNQSIKRITTTRPGQYFDWVGAVIAYGKTHRNLSLGGLRDLDMEDFQLIAKYFLSCGFNLSLPETPPIFPDVKAVRINCVGDKILNRPQFEQIELPANDPIFNIHDTSDILNRIGVPVFTQRCAPDPRWEEYLTSYANPHARFLHLHCNPEKEDWGMIARRWVEKPGSVIIVRQDKKPLSLFHAEALCKYCCDEVFGIIEKATRVRGDEDHITREFAASMICRPLFTIFRNKLIHEKLEKHEDVDDMTCPLSRYWGPMSSAS
ncbi:hypothetical protein F4680DRAFT_466018 [Xylaria scruposa]|nr:hypothetical protein F4680DRAFT_466018 [Xylaria scruposa]